MGPPPAHTAALPPAYDAPDRRLVPGVTYAATPGLRPLELDLHLPAEPPAPGRSTPVVVFVHGGGWRVGSRHSVGPAYAAAPLEPFTRLTRAGIAVASVDHRLSGEATWPAPLHDVRAAVRWLRRRGPELGLDPSRVAAWGESAGGHLAALLGLAGPSLAGEVGLTDTDDATLDAPAVAVVDWYGPTDLLAIAPTLGADPAALDSREALMLGAPLSDEPDRAREASPVTHVESGAPPFLLLHGEADRFVPVDQSRRLHRRLQEVGVEAELVTYPGADHLWGGSAEAAADALDRTVDFLVAQLRP